MSDVKPTPGPWSITPDGYRVVARPHAGEHIAVLAYTALNNPSRTPEAGANARLIAAAPELLAVVKAYVAACHEQDIKLGAITGDAEAAIAKAEGR